MNPLEEVQAYVRKHHPAAITNITPPPRPYGFWTLEVDTDTVDLCVEWSADVGFGICEASAANAFESGFPQHPTHSPQEAGRRIIEWITTGKLTSVD